MGEKKPVKKRGGKSASVHHNTSASADDVRRIGQELMYWYRMEPAVTDEEIAERLDHYFQVCFEKGSIPTVEAMALALGYSTRTILRWEVGEEGSTPLRRRMIKKAKQILATYDANSVTEGRLNPVTYIFRSKNFFGMKDKVEHTVAPANPLGDLRSPDEVEKFLDEGIPEDIIDIE